MIGLVGDGYQIKIVIVSNAISLGAGDNIGRSTEKANHSDDLDFDDLIVKPYEPRVRRDDIENEKTSNLSPTRPPEEVKSFDKKEVQNIIESFNPDKLDNDNKPQVKAKGDGQYVDPKHK